MSKQLKLPTLLVIADNPSIRFWVKNHLDPQFFVLSAETKQQALDALNANPDFIIIDAAFEECDPLDLCKTLSQFTKKQLIPILLITGKLKKSFRAQATEAGVNYFLSDQLDIEELQARLAEGLQAAAVRHKTETLGLSIKLPAKPKKKS
jgi:PleD family two-component response regulator